MKWLSALQQRYRVSADPLLTERRLELGVLLLLALLALQLLVNAVDLAVAPNPEPVLPTAESLQVGQVAPRRLVNSEQSAQIRARPLFFESRRPQAAEEQVAAEEPAPKQKKTKAPELKLVGVFGAADMRGIIALHKGERLRLLVGEDVSGWTLQQVNRDRALLNNGGESHSIALQRTNTGITPTSEPESARERDSDGANTQDQNEKEKDDKPKRSGGLTLGGHR